MSEIEIKFIQDFSELAPYVERWKSLLEAISPEQGTNTIFQTFEWNSSWWKVFGTSHKLAVVTAQRGDRLLGLAPLMVWESWQKFKKMRILGFIGTQNHASDYCDFLIHPDHPEALEEILDWILGKGAQFWDRVDLTNLPGHSPNRARLERLADSRRLSFLSRRLYDAPTRVLGKEDEDRKALSKESIKRSLKFFKSQGEVSFRHLGTKEEMGVFTEIFFDQHIRRWTGTPFPSLFLEPRQKEFYRVLINELAPTGLLRFGILCLNDNPIAFHFGFECQGRYIWYKPSFDIRLQKSPGEVLLRFCLEHAINRGLKEFDFTIGSEGYKYRFANKIRVNQRFMIFASRWDYLKFFGNLKLRSAAKAAISSVRGIFSRGGAPDKVNT